MALDFLDGQSDLGGKRVRLHGRDVEGVVVQGARSMERGVMAVAVQLDTGEIVLWNADKLLPPRGRGNLIV